MTEIDPTFSQRMLKALKRAGMSQADLCKATGISSSTISNYANAQAVPTLPRVIMIADALNTDVNDLCGFDQGNSRLEAYVLTCMKAMNEAGQKKVAEYANILYRSGDFRKQKSGNSAIQNTRTA